MTGEKQKKDDNWMNDKKVREAVIKSLKGDK